MLTEGDETMTKLEMVQAAADAGFRKKRMMTSADDSVTVVYAATYGTGVHEAWVEHNDRLALEFLLDHTDRLTFRVFCADDAAGLSMKFGGDFGC